MNKNTRFIEAEYGICREEDNDEFQIRLISDDVVMYKNYNKEEARKLRDILNNVILKDE
jgi:hypothetical protein